MSRRNGWMYERTKVGSKWAFTLPCCCYSYHTWWVGCRCVVDVSLLVYFAIPHFVLFEYMCVGDATF